MRSQVPDVVVLPEIVSLSFEHMSAKLKTSHSFPKDRTIENSDISPSKQSAGDGDDEICGKNVQSCSLFSPVDFVLGKSLYFLL